MRVVTACLVAWFWYPGGLQADDFARAYQQANESARQWKAKAEALDGALRTTQLQAAELAQQLRDTTARLRRSEADLAQTRGQQGSRQIVASTAPTQRSAPASTRKAAREFEIVLPQGAWVWAGDYDGPAVRVCLANVGMTFIDFAVSNGGAFRRIEINKGFEGNPNNRALLVTQNGRSLYWVDTLRRKSGEGVFLVVHESG